MYSPAEDEAEALGRLIRSFRKQAGLSLTECAKRIGVTHSTLSRFERGERLISAETLARFSRVLADIANKKDAA